MVDSIGTIGSSAAAAQRAQAAATANSSVVLNAVARTSQKTSGAVAPVKVFSVTQAAKSGGSSNAKVPPRGSIVDQFA